MATALEKYFLRITRARWQRLYRHGYTTGDFEVAFKSKAHVSKNHPRNFQRKVLDIYAQKLKAYGVAIESD